VTHVERAAADDQDAEDRELSTLYLHDFENGTTRPLTAGKTMDAHPAFSPDGGTIAFLRGEVAQRGASDGREKKKQIYLIPVDGGEARALTSLSQGAGAPYWSPDGTAIAFAAGIDYGEEEKPDRAKDPYRVTRNVWRFDGIGDLDLAVTNLYVTDVASRLTSRITDHDGMVGSIRWSPDGSLIFYSLSKLPDRWNGTHNRHYVIRPGGEIVHDIDDRPTWGDGTWLPDGSGLVFIGVESTDTPIGTHPDLWVYRLSDGSASNRTAGMELDLDGSLEARMPAHRQRDCGIVVDPSGQYAYLQVQRAGRVGICRIALEGEPSCEPLIDGERTCSLYDCVPADSVRLLYAVADIVTPPDLYVADVSGAADHRSSVDGVERRVTDLNGALTAELVVPTVRELEFPGSDGTAVHGWFVSPPRSAGPSPTILWIHGGPHGAQGFQFAFDTLLLAGAGYGVMFVNHRASTGYGDAFSTAIHGDWGNLDYRDLMAGVDFAVAEGLADPDRLGCCGISGGGNLSSWIVSHTNRFKAAVPQNPVTSWRSFYGVSDIGVWFSRKQLGGDPHEIPEVYDRCSPITTAHTCTTPTLLIQCEDDFRCPAEQSEQFYTVLRANGCIVEMLRQPGGAHGGSIRGPLPLRVANLEAKLDWFDRYIPRRGAT
jgi:dipeptidyl aminopeptidase/acylaminoacyl peptidase